MKATVDKIEMVSLDGHGRPSSVLLRWAGLFFGLFLIWVFMFVIAPWVEKWPSVKPIADFVEETGINASGLYYTDVEETSEAELNLRSTFEYAPAGGKPQAK